MPHLHVHLVPRNRKDGLRGFFWPRRKYDSEEHMRETAAAIREVQKKGNEGRRQRRDLRVNAICARQVDADCVDPAPLDIA